VPLSKNCDFAAKARAARKDFLKTTLERGESCGPRTSIEGRFSLLANSIALKSALEKTKAGRLERPQASRAHGGRSNRETLRSSFFWPQTLDK
jgi:hypothetical protein